jgi:uncharacterized protein (TIGR03067 family)
MGRDMYKTLALLACLSFGGLCGTAFSQDKAPVTDALKSDETNESMLKRFNGEWSLNEASIGGNPFPAEVMKSLTMKIKDGGYEVIVNQVRDAGKLTVDVSKAPMAMDISGEEGPNKGKILPCIFKCEKEKLIICYQLNGDERPTEFESPKNSTILLATYERLPEKETPSKETPRKETPSKESKE